jgi:glycosyltransferase involved in cell wall biosynthesis
MSRVAAVIVPSHAMHEVFARHGIESRIVALPVRLPAGSVMRQRAAAATFTYCGRLSCEKGVARLLRAFARVCERHPAATLRILGDGRERPALEHLAGSLDLGDRVVFRGHLAFADVEAELQSSWALVAPSLWMEPFGLVAPEAIVRHVPVIASRTGGFAETVVDGVTGLLVPNGDVSALSDAMDAVAAGRAFAGPHLPDEALAALRERTGEARHAGMLQALFREVLARRGVA